MSTTTPPNKQAQTSQPILAELAARYSPLGFSEKPIPEHVTVSLFEAARWAPSAFNDQPWLYLVGDIGDPAQHSKVLHSLVDANQVWAKYAPLLLIAVARENYKHNGKPNPHAWHDVGMANMSLATEATRHGLCVHMMAGIHYDQIREEFGLPEGYAPVCGLAVGYPEERDLPEHYAKREAMPRTRKPMEEILVVGSFGEK